MANSSQNAVTPGSSIGKAPAVKDKECPFCHQAFTSSSLGRHLDIYLKGKNPKPPDGVHDVDEIRRLRGNITRRRICPSGRRDVSTPSSAKGTPSRDQSSPSVSQSLLNGQDVDGEPFRTFFNKANWQATGVINNLPPTPRNDPSMWATRRDHADRTEIKKEICLEEEHVITDNVDCQKAAELALKEVLEGVKAARLRARPPALFEFNFFGLSFPQIYLQCLIPPPTLLAEPTSRPHELSWSTNPPGTMQYDLLRGWLATRLRNWQRQRESLYLGNANLNNDSIGYSEPRVDAAAAKAEETPYYEHLDRAQQRWISLSDKERSESWQYECAKAFAREQESHKVTKRRLDEAEQEIQQLRTRFDLNPPSRQSPNGRRYTPGTLSLSGEALSHLSSQTDWDYDALILKWRNRLQNARTFPSQPQLPQNTATPNGRSLRANDSGRLFAPQHDASWPYRDEESDGQEDEDEDLADAPGEEDPDGDIHMEQHANIGNDMMVRRSREDDTAGVHRGKRRKDMDAS